MNLAFLRSVPTVVWGGIAVAGALSLAIGAAYYGGRRHERADWEKAKLAWEDSTRTLVQSADTALAQHVRDSAALTNRGQRIADSLTRITEAASQAARRERLAAQVAKDSARALSLALSRARTAPDSIVLLLERDIERQLRIEFLEAASLEDSVVLATERARVAQLRTDLGLARADGTRLAGAVDSLRQVLTRAVRAPERRPTFACVAGATASVGAIRLKANTWSDYAGLTCGLTLKSIRL